MTLAYPHALVRAWHLFVAIFCPLTFFVFSYSYVTIERTKRSQTFELYCVDLHCMIDVSLCGRTIMHSAPDQGPHVMTLATALDFITGFIFLVDIFLEILTATPTTGKQNSLKSSGLN